MISDGQSCQDSTEADKLYVYVLLSAVQLCFKMSHHLIQLCECLTVYYCETPEMFDGLARLSDFSCM